MIVVAAVALAVLAVVKRWKIGVAVAVNLAGIYVLNEIIKHIVRRPRPDFPHLVFEQGYSFPSGHAMVSTAFYGFIVLPAVPLLAHARDSRPRGKIVAIVLLCLIPPVVMFTRSIWACITRATCARASCSQSPGSHCSMCRR